ncbi:MAG: GNAT family N-acetyltransferase [Myxococcota bacterium]
MIRGSCLCGGVRFEVARAVGPFELCHCSRCRKASGSAFAAMVGVDGAGYRLLAGAELIASYDAPILRAPPAYRTAFCRRCGSPVPSPEPGADWFELPAGLLEDDPGVRPDRHIFVELTAPWDATRDGLPRLTAPELAAWRRQHGHRPQEPLAWEALATPRLRLRRPRVADAALVFEAFGHDPEVMRFLAWRPHASLADAEAALGRRIERLANGVEYSWILEAEGAAVGMISAWRDGAALELGFVLTRSAWGRGLMTEAARAVVDWAIGAGVRRVWATCDVENGASARVLSKAGLAPQGPFERPVVRPNLSSGPRPSLLFSVESKPA